MRRIFIYWATMIVRSVKEPYKALQAAYSGVGEPDRARSFRRIGNWGFLLGGLIHTVRAVLVLTGAVRRDGFTEEILFVYALICWAFALQTHSLATGYTMRYREEPMDLDVLDRGRRVQAKASLHRFGPEQVNRMLDDDDSGGGKK